jgi:hypothetical protein
LPTPSATTTPSGSATPKRCQRARGAFLGGIRAPFGWRALNDGQIEPEPTEQAALTDMSSWRNANRSLAEIVALVKNRHNINITREGVRRALRRPQNEAARIAAAPSPEVTIAERLDAARTPIRGSREPDYVTGVSLSNISVRVGPIVRRSGALLTAGPASAAAPAQPSRRARRILA